MTYEHLYFVVPGGGWVIVLIRYDSAEQRISVISHLEKTLAVSFMYGETVEE